MLYLSDLSYVGPSGRGGMVGSEPTGSPSTPLILFTTTEKNTPVLCVISLMLFGDCANEIMLKGDEWRYLFCETLRMRGNFKKENNLL